jgi:2,4-dichlorophenol 6-monooxygenase
VTREICEQLARQLIGDNEIPIDITSWSTWTVNHMHATRYAAGRVFCMGDAVHRHPPSNGLGSNTSIQDAYNLSWKLAAVLKGHADPHLLDSYDAERAPIGKQVVDRANKSIAEFGPIFGALGLLESTDPAVMTANMDARKEDTADAQQRRKSLREAIAAKIYEFDAHGVEMNQRYVSDAVAMSDGDSHAFSDDPELVYQPTTTPGARVPHVWLVQDRQNYSSLDLCGQGRFTLLTGIGGEGWRQAASAVTAELGVSVTVVSIGPDCDYEDPFGDWARARGVEDDGAVLVRPDQFVAWRAEGRTGDLRGALQRILGRG